MKKVAEWDIFKESSGMVMEWLWSLQGGSPSGNQTWQVEIPYKWRFIVGKINYIPLPLY